MNGGNATAYDAPAAGGRRSLPAQPQAASSSAAPRVRPPPIPYAAPGSSSGSMNPASTVAFMLNMGYPPPPIALESLRRLLEQMTQGPGQTLNLQSALHVTDEISRSPYRIAPAVLFVIQQRLHSSKPDRVTLALELLDMCVKNCGLDFVRHINKDFMKSMSSVVKTTSFKERTITGQMKKLEKYLTGSPSSTGVATDPRVHKVRRHALTLIQNWSDAFMMHPNQIGPILDCYKGLKRKGIQFPPRDTSQKYLVKHAETSPAFDSTQGVPQPPEQSAASVFAGESVFSSSGSPRSADEIPFSEKQFMQLEKLIALLKSSDDAEMVERAIAMCERLRPKLERSMRGLTAQINSSSGKKLRGSDPKVTQLNAILDLDTEILKRRGTRLLFPKGEAEPAIARPLSEKAVTSPPKTISLLDDLLDAPDTVVRSPVEPAIEMTKICPQPVGSRPGAVDHFAGLYSSPETNVSSSPFDNIVLLADPKETRGSGKVFSTPPERMDAPDLFAPDNFETSNSSAGMHQPGDASDHFLGNAKTAPVPRSVAEAFAVTNANEVKQAFASKETDMQTSSVFNAAATAMRLDGLRTDNSWSDHSKAPFNRNEEDREPMDAFYRAAAGATASASDRPKEASDKLPFNPIKGVAGAPKEKSGEGLKAATAAQDDEVEWMSAGRSSFTDSDTDGAVPAASQIAAAVSAPVVASQAAEQVRRESAGSVDGGLSRQDEEADKLFGQMMAREQTRWEGNEEFFKALQKEARIADMDTLI